MQGILSIAILYSDKDSDFEDLFLLPELGKRSEKHAEQAERLARHGKQLDTATLPPDQCKSLPGPVEAPDFPQELVGSNRTRCTRLEGLCFFLRRLAYLNHLEDIGVFGRGVSELSLFYSGHKHIHTLKFQSVMSPFGIIVHLFGPVEGQRHVAHTL